MSSAEERCFTVKGRVQGVFFRACTVRWAQQLGLVGYVKNNANGTVSVVAQGAPSALDQLYLKLKKGSPLSKVTQVDFEQVSDKQELYARFEIIDR